ncbi:ATREV3; DNA binding protein-like protein [Naegleria gruberi]|uniref:DNA polymerase n=1 Tax=Naegleria gruberi TaxID=5762 RepID=D2VRX3_NAEGR|nr:ATREV3; DNA binding protein-like protein [Naegleria gruberi]EFC40538.1 ATREV3; DNA binding protein-like protein [Naegleria gruberi]|eukprot:XP_002673282.1 ATREV3; DNA binding protein-like protein [Naegleria gruberi strain NEG-M]
MHVYGTVQETKQKACLHVHQLYPYFMLSFPHELFSSNSNQNNSNINSSNNDDSDDLTSIYQNMDMKKVNQFISVLGASIEDTFHQSLFGHTLNQYERTLKNNPQQQPSFHIHPRQFVHDIVLVSGKPFYGYWFNHKLFLKVYVYNPSHVGKMAAMFGNGTVMGHRFSVYEAHIPFPLQFMMDYNLYGMGDLSVEKLYFRLPFNSFRDDMAADKISSQNAIQYGTILPDNVKRLSKCEIEMDAFSRDVMNRKDIVDLQLSLEDEKEESFGKERKLIRSLNVIWEEERRRRRSLEKASQPFIPCSPFERQEKRPQNELEGYMYDNLMKIVENMNRDDNYDAKHQVEQENESLILTSQLPKAFSQKSATPQQQDSNLKKSQQELNDFLSKFPTAFQTYEEIKEIYLASRDNSYFGQGNALFNIQLTQGDLELENVLNWMRDKDFELKEDEYNNLGDYQEDEEDNEEEESEDSLIQDEQEMLNSMKEVFSGNEQIFHVDEEEEQVSDEEWNVSSDSEGEDVVEFIPQFDGTHPETKSRKQNKRITIESVNIGDFVYMRAPKNSKPYIACILDKNNEKKTIQVRWFYRPEETKTGARDWTGVSEIFLISQSDTNPFETVVGKCKVLVVDDYFRNMPPNVQMPSSLYDQTSLPEEFTDHNEDTFFCRFEYSVRKDEYKPLSSESKQILQNYERKVLLPAKKRKISFADEEQPSETEVTPQSTNDNFFFDNFFSQAKHLPQDKPSEDITVSTLMMEQALESFDPDRFNFAANSSSSSSIQPTPPIIQEEPTETSPPLASNIAKQVNSPFQSPIIIPTIAEEEQPEVQQEEEEFLEKVFNVELTPPMIDISPPSEKFEPSAITTISNETSPIVVTLNETDSSSVVRSGNLILDFKEPPSIEALENELHESAIAYKGLIRQMENYPFFSSHDDYLESKRSSLIRFSSIFGKKKLNEEMPKSKDYKELPFLNFKSKLNPIERPVHKKFGKLILDFAPKPPSLSMVYEELSQEKKPVIADIEEIHRPLSPQYDEPILDVASSLTARKLLSLNNTPNTLRNRAPEYQSLLSELSVMSERKKIAFDEAAIPRDNKKKKDLVSKQNLSVMCIECHVLTRATFLPNPLYDSVQTIVITYQNCANIAESLEHWLLVNREMEADDAAQRPLAFPTHFDRVIEFKNEKDLYEGFIDVLCKVDPDILLGYEIQTEGLGYLIERGFLVMGRNVCFEISRVANFQSDKPKVDKKKATNTSNNFQREKALKKAQEYARNKQSGVMIKGRVVMNVWRIMNGELKLDMYTLHNVVFNVLGRRIPFYSHQTLTDLSHSCSHEKDSFEYRVILQYYLIKTSVTLEVLNHLDILNRTGELGKVYGIEFFSVISRGSQYRVESMMLRLARLRNYVALSPTRKQVMEQAAIECLPLVMEPQSKLYTNPMIVLDFQSLYPSIIIAYNLCYSTCLGKLAFVDRKKTKLGTLENYEPNNELRKLLQDRTGSDSIEEDIFITPNQCLFVKPNVRQGVLPRMCSEILNTRIMVKQAMKETSKDDKETQRILNARQLGLKLIANVTYGYTSANFSGRMPLSDLADAIVQLARATLENAIDIVNEKFPGKCRIAYGDTDSLFVECINSTREEAFKLGKEIVKHVTNANPRPITLQMERVFHPSYLVSKKRYVGMAYESPAQTKGTLFCKGIEAVRRDNCLMVRSLMEKSLEILFESLDFSRVKAYLSRQFYRIISEKCSLQDFIFWKKVKLGYYKSERHLPPSARIAVREMQRDPRAEPRFNERVPYVVVFSSLNPAKAKLSDMVIHPKYFIEDRMNQVQNYKQKYRIHYNYYITRQLLPSIDRLFSLSFVNCNIWYTNLPKKDIYLLADWRKQVFRKSKNFIEQYFQPLSRPCSSCGKIIDSSKKDVTVDLLCSDCNSYPLILLLRRRATEKRLNELKELCRYCNHSLDMTNGLLPNSSFSMEQKCLSLECPILYSKMQSFNNLQSLMEIKQELI